MAGRDSAIRSITSSNVSNVQSTRVTGIPLFLQLTRKVGNSQRGKQFFDRVFAPEVGIDKSNTGEGAGGSPALTLFKTDAVPYPG